MRRLLYLFIGVFACCVAGSVLFSCGEPVDSTTPRSVALFTFDSLSVKKDTGSVTKKLDSLTVIALNTVIGDSVIKGKTASVSFASVPLSYTKTETAVVFKFIKNVSDTIWITHTNTPHFISMDAGIAMYYHIDNVRYTSHAIDSVSIINPEVDTNEKDNIRLHF